MLLILSGVTGRACDTCKPRHVLTSRGTCQNCDDGCVGSLLDSVAALRDNLRHSINLEDLDPAPMRKLTHYTNLSSVLDTEVDSLQQSRDQVAAMAELEAALGSEAELSLLEATKFAKTAEAQVDTAGSLKHEARDAVDEEGDGDISKEEFVKNAMKSKFICNMLKE